MARKSRKNIILNNEVKSIEKTFNVGVYVRLSIEDLSSKERNSIENQKEIITNYIADKSDLNVYRIYEDNGKTGTNFERKGFTDLMDDVRNGKINCIIVKDLSRFGRSYLEVGNYLEKIFPFLGTRFISINDNYDNFDVNCSTSDLIISFKNVVNQMYSADLSKKVCSAMLHKKLNGESLCVPCYGYAASKDGTHKLVIDPEAADVIRKIFDWRVEGCSLRNIVINLHDLNIDTPTVYKRKNGIMKNSDMKYSNIWTTGVVSAILLNQIYIGHTHINKTVKTPENIFKRMQNKKENWTIIENTHEPIIEIEQFNAVSEISKKLNSKFIKSPYDKVENIFKGKVYCLDCGMALIGKAQRLLDDHENVYYRCINRKYSNKNCEKIFLKSSNLKKIILELILIQVKIYKEAKNFEQQDKILRPIKKINYNKELLRLENDKVKLYESYRENKITKEIYRSQKDLLDKKVNDLEKLIANCNKKTTLKSIESKKDNPFEQFINTDVLTKEMINCFVSKIEYGSGKNIVVTMKYKDEINMLKSHVETALSSEVLL